MSVVAEVAQAVFGGVWDLLLGTQFPGVGVSIASVALSLLIIRFSIRIFGFFTGFGLNGGDYGRMSDMAEKEKAKHDWENRRKIGF